MNEHRVALTAPPGTGDYRLVAWVFLRLLALIYLAAFVSMAIQVEALAGSGGIYPIAEQLAQARSDAGVAALLAYPSLFWLASGDWALLLVAWGGTLLSLLLLVWPWTGRAARSPWGERIILLLLYSCYLSLYQAGQMFTNFQWDTLLLETGLLAVLLPGGPRLVVWLFRWLLFRLRFESGFSKLLTGDSGWRELTALRTYFETQPIPHAGAWYAHHLPDWILRLGTGTTLFVELVVPFFIFLPRPWRLAAAGITVLWQVLIIATSNHNYFNLLTILLCLFLLDDRAVRALIPGGWPRRALTGTQLPGQPRRTVRAVALALAVVLVPASLVPAGEMLAGRPSAALRPLVSWLAPFGLAKAYHVFPKIETRRIEIQFEASRDGIDWQLIAFRYRPGDPGEMTPFIVPHQPRLDWMLWFVPQSPAFMDMLSRFLDRLLEGSPTVTALLAQPPIEDGPPRLIRLRVYRYRFSTPAERTSDGDWWKREDLGPFYPLPSVERRP